MLLPSPRACSVGLYLIRVTPSIMYYMLEKKGRNQKSIWTQKLFSSSYAVTRGKIKSVNGNPDADILKTKNRIVDHMELYSLWATPSVIHIRKKKNLRKGKKKRNRNCNFSFMGIYLLMGTASIIYLFGFEKKGKSNKPRKNAFPITIGLYFLWAIPSVIYIVKWIKLKKEKG